MIDKSEGFDAHELWDPRERASDTLSERQACVIASLVNGESVMEASELAGVHRSTLYRWFQDPGFLKALERAKRDHCEMIKCELNYLATEAVRTLRYVMASTSHTPELRLKIAREILKAAGIDHPGALYLRAEAEAKTIEQGGEPGITENPAWMAPHPLLSAPGGRGKTRSRRRRKNKQPASSLPALAPPPSELPSPASMNTSDWDAVES